tara:strand:+ start:738 stop:2294 length:1557 start_codon:yes stop_codon:yes gene_type:complete
MRFALFLLVVLAIVGIAMGLPTRVAIEQHEGDLFHMIDAGLRLQAGEIPHLDFMTPLGILSIAPMALFLSLGFAGGKAALLSNLLVAILITPVLWWVGQTRMEGKMRFFFGASMLILVSALTYGGGSVSTSLSMYYNRWSWAVVFILLVAILWRAPEGEKPYKLGLLTGIGLSLLALTKMTFFIAFAPPIAIMLVVQRRYRVAGIASLVGGIVLIATTLAFGPAFWVSYAQDLFQVAFNSQRSQPGENLLAVFSAPRFLAGTASIVAAIIWLRKTGQEQMGLFLLLLLPAFAFTTWQNWGNDPKWLFLVGLVVVAKLRVVSRAREQGAIIATIAFVALAPTMTTLTVSLPRGVFAEWERFGRIVDAGPISDIWLVKDRLNSADVIMPALGLEGDTPERVFLGAEIPNCRVYDGLVRLAVAYAQQIARRPEAAGAGIFLADLVNIMPLISDQRRLKGGAPWYYGGDSGFADMDFVVIPKCPMNADARDKAMDALEASDVQLELVEETPQMFLFAVNRPQ